MKLCPDHGPIDFPADGINCPACGLELEYFASALDAALSLPGPPPVGPEQSGGPAAANPGRLFPEGD